MLDILNTALRLVLTREEPGVRLDDEGRVVALNWRPAGRGTLYPPDIPVPRKLPYELGQFQELTRLALGGPQLTGNIPPELSRLPHLHTLELHSNRLTAVPAEDGQFQALQHLSLNHNRLTALPPEIGQLSQLHYLGLACNRLASLPVTLRRLPQLFHLEL